MNDSDYSIIKSLYLEAFDLDESARLDFLDERVGDPELRRELDRLFGYKEDPRVSRPVLSASSVVSLVSAPREEPTEVGGYRIHRLIGEGGMGAVYEATQEAPRRTVALKVLRGGLSSPAAIRRFEIESELLGRLQHSGIAQVYEAGHDPAIGPFIAMELVDGIAIDAWTKTANADRQELIELWIEVCDGVQHAHQRGIIHRDLKPGNILVTPEGRAKILDFGIARALDEDHRTTSARTRFGEIMGTFAYMSPEQASGDPTLVDTRSDVYALGLIGYEMLTGHPGRTLAGLSVPEAMTEITRADIPAPRSRKPDLAGDLETILRTATEPDQGRRYQSAAALRDDLRRFLSREPITAHPASAWYQCRMFARRYRSLVASAGVIAVVMLVAISGILFYAIESDRQSKWAKQESARADAKAEVAERSQYVAILRAATAAIDRGNPREALNFLEQVAPERRHWEWRHVRARLDSAELLFGHEAPVVGDVAFRNNGDLIYLDQGGELRSFSMSEFQEQSRINVGDDACSFSISPSGKEVATGHTNGFLRVWSLDTSELLEEREIAATEIKRTTFGPRGLEIFARTAFMGFIWNRGDLVLEVSGAKQAWGWHPEGILGVGSSREVFNCETAFPEGVLTGNAEEVSSLAFSPGGESVAFGTRHPAIQVVDLESEELKYYLRATGRGVSALTWAKDGERIFTGDLDGGVTLWNLKDKRREQDYLGHDSPVNKVVESPDGVWLAAATRDRIRVWRVRAPGEGFTGRGHQSYAHHAAFNPDGSLIASLAWDSTLRIWDGSNLDPLVVLARGLRGPTGLAWSRDGSKVIPSSRAARIYDLASAAREGRQVKAFSDLGRLAPDVAWPGRIGRESSSLLTRMGLMVAPKPALLRFLIVRDMEGAIVRELEFASDIRQTTVSQDEKWLAVSRARSPIVILDTRDWSTVATLDNHRSDVYALCFSPDGTRFVSGGADRTVRVWDTETWSEVAALEGHEGEIRSLQFSPDGRRLVSSSSDSTIRLWLDRPRHELRPGLSKRINEARSSIGESSGLALSRAIEEKARQGLVDSKETIQGVDRSGFGISLAVLENAGPGGKPALLIGAPASPPRQCGAVELWSLDPPQQIWRMGGEAPGQAFGKSVTALGDLDGDGVVDFAVGAPGDDAPGLERCGSVSFCSGRDGALISKCYGDRAKGQIGRRVFDLGDVDGDGKSDVFATPVSARIERQFGIYSSASNRAIRNWPSQKQAWHEARVVEDFDGDGVLDVGLIHRRSGLRVMSGKTGEMIRTIRPPEIDKGALAAALRIKTAGTQKNESPSYNALGTPPPGCVHLPVWMLIAGSFGNAGSRRFAARQSSLPSTISMVIPFPISPIESTFGSDPAKPMSARFNSSPVLMARN